jgi:hypothetical protein
MMTNNEDCRGINLGQAAQISESRERVIGDLLIKWQLLRIGRGGKFEGTLLVPEASYSRLCQSTGEIGEHLFGTCWDGTVLRLVATYKHNRGYFSISLCRESERPL